MFPKYHPIHGGGDDDDDDNDADGDGGDDNGLLPFPIVNQSLDQELFQPFSPSLQRFSRKQMIQHQTSSYWLGNGERVKKDDGRCWINQESGCNPNNRFPNNNFKDRSKLGGKQDVQISWLNSN